MTLASASGTELVHGNVVVNYFGVLGLVPRSAAIRPRLHKRPQPGAALR